MPEERIDDPSRTEEVRQEATETHEDDLETSAEDMAEVRREAERLKSQLAKANADAKRSRARLEELEEAERKREESKLGETEKARRREAEREQKTREMEHRAAELEQKLRDERVAIVAEREARIPQKDRGEFLDPELVHRLINRSLVEFNEDGEPTKKSIREALDQIAKDHPNQVRAKSSGGTPPREGYKSPQYRGDGRGRGQETPEEEAYRRRLETGEYAKM